MNLIYGWEECGCSGYIQILGFHISLQFIFYVQIDVYYLYIYIHRFFHGRMIINVSRIEHSWRLKEQVLWWVILS